jgi:hypothetical protein
VSPHRRYRRKSGYQRPIVWSSRPVGLVLHWAPMTLRVIDDDDLPEDLYHYTDAGGLHGILENNTLWTTHAAYVNDSQEFFTTNLLWRFQKESQKHRTLQLRLSVCPGSSQNKHACFELSVAVEVGHMSCTDLACPLSSSGFGRGTTQIPGTHLRT